MRLESVLVRGRGDKYLVTNSIYVDLKKRSIKYCASNDLWALVAFRGSTV
jgi:hypothetical protein